MLKPWNIDPAKSTIERAVVYTFHSALSTQWRRERLLLAGDAAHQMPPFLGQGMCSGLRDAANLAWKLRDVIAGDAPDSLLDTYETERMEHVRAFIELAVELGRRDPDHRSRKSPPARPRSHRQSDHAAADHAAAWPRPPRRRSAARGNPRRRSRDLADGTLLDDRVGYRFAVLATRAWLLNALPVATRARLDDADVVLVVADGEVARLSRRACAPKPLSFVRTDTFSALRRRRPSSKRCWRAVRRARSERLPRRAPKTAAAI